MLLFSQATSIGSEIDYFEALYCAIASHVAIL
jgi:hypothetical protein